MSKDEYLITDTPLKALTVFAMPMIRGSFFQQIYNMADSLLYKEDFAWMKKQTLLRLNRVFRCIVLLMNKNKKKNRQC